MDKIPAILNLISSRVERQKKSIEKIYIHTYMVYNGNKYYMVYIGNSIMKIKIRIRKS